jgi:hypothetical protein
LTRKIAHLAKMSFLLSALLNLEFQKFSIYHAITPLLCKRFVRCI